MSTNPTVGFSNIATSYKNGIATCSFTRAIKMPSVTNYFDASQSYYILAAIGPLQSGQISYHSFDHASLLMFSFQNVSFINSTKTTTPISITKPIPSKNIGTYQAENTTINWIVTENDNSTNITMQRTMSQNSWFAFGLSTDKHMVIFKDLFYLKI